MKVRNKAEAAPLTCGNFSGIVLFVMQNSIHKGSLKDLIRDLHYEVLEVENIPLCLFFLSLQTPCTADIQSW